MASEAVAKLARLFILLDQQKDLALSLDGYDRWGGNSSYPAKDEHAAIAGQIPRTRQRIKASIAALRESDPAALDRFVDAQLRLLEVCRHHSTDKTAHHVAKEEAEAWEKVRAGEADFVDCNSHFIKKDPATFEELFGFSLYDVSTAEAFP